MAALQNTLHRQLINQPLPESAKSDELIALGVLADAAREQSVLLVLDDVWVASHATPLNFVHQASMRSRVVVTTRIRSLIAGASDIQCGTLSTEAALELLLRVGGCEHLLSSPPPAALEAVDLCGRLPLALGIAGGIILELADTWQDDLCVYLRGEFEEASVEDRVVTASLRVVPEAMRAGVEGLFRLFAVFAEDATIPATTIDLLAPLMAGDASVRQAAGKKMQVRRWLQQLLDANILRGSMDGGLSVHDLVRDCMIRRAEATEGGLRAIQREVVQLLLTAFGTNEPGAGFALVGLNWHVRQAQQPGVSVDQDELLMSVLAHDNGAIRRQGVIGIGVTQLLAAADECDKKGEHLKSAYMFAAVGGQGTAGSAELLHARVRFTLKPRLLDIVHLLC